jgi:putative nucleotidyltransferase with HDIG domain
MVILFAVVYLFPREAKFRYAFDTGKLWLYDTYYSPFDAAIKKTPEEYNKEVEQAIKNSRLYFIFDDQIILEKEFGFDEALRRFLKQLSLRIGSVESDDAFTRNFPEIDLFKTDLIKQLKEIYQRGIVQQHKHLKEQPKDFRIVVIKDKISQEIEFGDLMQEKDAVELLVSRLQSYKGLNPNELKNFLEQFISPNVFYSEDLTQSAREREVESISVTRGLISKGELIISKGEMVTSERYQLLESIRSEYETQTGAGNIDEKILILAQALISLFLLGMLMSFLMLFRKDLAEDNSKLTFIFVLILLFVFAISMVSRSKVLNIYVIPFCVLPIVLRAFFDTRLASFAHLITVLIMSFHTPDPLEFMLIVLSGGIVSIFSIVNMQKRSQLFITIALLFVVYFLMYASFTVVREGSSSSINFAQVGWLATGAAFTLLSYPFIYLFEKVFGFISDVSLLELSDTNNPLLKELALKAPGTFQHSLQVANLSEAAIRKIGGNSMLVRAGALYHDIGKMDMARYFVENQTTGVNPHDELLFDESARIIINHVRIGIEKARKHNVPDLIIDFIRTHHGTSRVQYFYKNYLKNFPEKVVDESMFSYPGPIPYSKETAVLMMADAVEATSRSLKKYDSESIELLINDIIDRQIEEQQFVNADITFKDITNIKKVFKRMLMNIYHVRIEYPETV